VVVAVEGLATDVVLEDEVAGQSMPKALVAEPGAPDTPVEDALLVVLGSVSKYAASMSPVLPPLSAPLEGRERDWGEYAVPVGLVKLRPRDEDMSAWECMKEGGTGCGGVVE